MATKEITFFNRVFRNPRGKIVIWQSPNLLLWCWIACSVLGVAFSDGATHNGFHRLGQAFLFAWAYLEIRNGESIFRKILGGTVLAYLIYGFFSA